PWGRVGWIKCLFAWCKYGAFAESRRRLGRRCRPPGGILHACASADDELCRFPLFHFFAARGETCGMMSHPNHARSGGPATVNRGQVAPSEQRFVSTLPIGVMMLRNSISYGVVAGALMVLPQQ